MFLLVADLDRFFMADSMHAIATSSSIIALVSDPSVSDSLEQVINAKTGPIQSFIESLVRKGEEFQTTELCDVRRRSRRSESLLFALS
jgi:hypothetical protein